MELQNSSSQHRIVFAANFNNKHVLWKHSKAVETVVNGEEKKVAHAWHAKILRLVFQHHGVYNSDKITNFRKLMLNIQSLIATSDK